MTDHMRTHALIVQSDFEHLGKASRDVAARARHDAQAAGDEHRAAAQWARAFRIGSIARQFAHVIAEHDVESDEWQKAIANGSLDDVLQALRVSLEQVDPAREAVAS